MLKQQLVDGKLLDEFDKRMAVVETAYADLTHATSDYWWNLYKIHQDDLWRARYDSHGDWLGTLLTERFGPRRQTFYTVMRAIERWKSFGMAYPKIYSLLGDRKVALEGDLEELFDRDGLKPEVAEQLEEQGITPLELIEQASELGPGEARSRMRQFVEKDQIFFLDDCAYNATTGVILANLRWDNETGLVGVWTVKITAQDVTEGKPKRQKGEFLPEELARFAASKLGIRI